MVLGFWVQFVSVSFQRIRQWKWRNCNQLVVFCFEVKQNKENMNEVSTSCCFLCTKNEEEVELIEIETNSMEISGEIVEFSEIFDDVFGLKVRE
jgi:TPP-dependent 2-oxoacid decarboxylase